MLVTLITLTGCSRPALRDVWCDERDAAFFCRPVLLEA